MKKILSLAILLVLFSSFLVSCKKDNGEPPELPPTGSMSIDFSNFLTQKKSAPDFSEQKGTENSTWEFAAASVGLWNLLLTTTLAVPVASFKLAINQTPVYIEDKTWQWSYSVTIGSVNYQAKLTGQIRSTDVLWKMYISGSFSEFLWFEGTSLLDGTSGQWILNESSQVTQPLLQIDWTKSSATIGSITYTYVKNDLYKNSSIEYGLTDNALNAYYSIHVYSANFEKFIDVDIEWNTTSHEGRVKSIDYLGDSDWYCWNSNKINSVCE